MQTLAISVSIGILAFILGLAIQRGSTCAVRAVSDLIYRRRADMFLGFFECSLFVLLVIWLVQSTSTVPDWASVFWLCTGAVVFGVGATINDGCAFGSIARLGTGRLDYILTGLGAWLAFFLLDKADNMQPSSKTISPENLPVWIVFAGIPLLILLRWRMRPRPMHKVLTLSCIMAAIGICGALLTILDQPWPWMRALQLISHTNIVNTMAFGLLLAGSVIGGINAGRFKPKVPGAVDLRNRFIGGLVMGAGSVIIPGGNDSFILHGLSSGNGLAFLGYMVMMASIAASLGIYRVVTK